MSVNLVLQGPSSTIQFAKNFVSHVLLNHDDVQGFTALSSALCTFMQSMLGEGEQSSRTTCGLSLYTSHEYS